MENKKEQFPTNFSLLKHFLRNSWGLFFVGIISACMVSLLDLVNPKIISYTVDTVIGNTETELPSFLQNLIDGIGGAAYLRNHLWLIGAAVIVVALLGALFRYLFQLFNAKGAETLVETMRNDLFEHILHLPFAWHSENHTGDIIQRCTSDVEQIKVFLSEQLTSLFRFIILIVLAFVFMATINVRLTIVAVIFLPIIIGYSLFFHNKIGDSFEKVDIEEGKLSSIAQENLTGVRVVRAFGRESYERERFEKQNKSYTHFWIYLMQLMAAFWATGDMFSYGQVLAILTYGAYLSVHGDLSAGNYIAFITYNTMLMWPIRGLGRIISNLSKAGISLERLRYILNSETEKNPEGAVKPDMSGDIVFNDVSYQYKNGTSEILEHINMNIKAGQTIGILGATGSGKSTLMYLLDRLYDLPPEQGNITIGGVDIQSIDTEYLRENIGMVLQEPYLFSRTLSENIAITQPSKDMMRVKEAARLASLDEAIEHFSKGYDTYVGERGVTLSGGQKQRAAIAQMLIRKPPIMVFDDSLSAVDAETDSKIREALKENTGDSTVIIIAHRLTTLMNADQIYVMDHGKIVEHGDHSSLLQKNGIYRRIYDLQTNQEGE